MPFPKRQVDPSWAAGGLGRAAPGCSQEPSTPRPPWQRQLIGFWWVLHLGRGRLAQGVPHTPTARALQTSPSAISPAPSAPSPPQHKPFAGSAKGRQSISAGQSRDRRLQIAALFLCSLPCRETDVVFFTLRVAEIPLKVLLCEKGRAAGAAPISGARPALPGCVRPGRELVGY